MVKHESIHLADIDQISHKKYSDECSTSPDGYCHYPLMCRILWGCGFPNLNERKRMKPQDLRNRWGITLAQDLDVEEVVRHIIMPEGYNPEEESEDKCVFCGGLRPPAACLCRLCQRTPQEMK